MDDSRWSSGSSSNQILFIAKCFSVFDNRTGAMPVSGNQISLFLSLLERELLKREVLVSDAKNSIHHDCLSQLSMASFAYFQSPLAFTIATGKYESGPGSVHASSSFVLRCFLFLM